MDFDWSESQKSLHDSALAAAHVFACVMPIVHHGGDALEDEVLRDLSGPQEIQKNRIASWLGL